MTHPASLYAAYRREVRRLLSNSITDANRHGQYKCSGSYPDMVKATQREMAALRAAYKPVRVLYQ
jgi:hypothetical protein